MRFWLVLAFAALTTISSASAMTDEPRLEEVAQLTKLNWITKPGTYTLGHGGNIVLSNGNMLVTGEDARKAFTLTNGVSDSHSVEALMLEQDDSSIYVEYLPIGYVTGDDWTNLDPNQLLETIRDNTVKANVERKAAGLPEFYVNQWISKPTYDRAAGTVYWSFDAIDQDNNRFVNTVALLLGRNGYARMTYAPTDATKANAIHGIKDLYKFQSGFRYADYVTGDKLAGIGVASLVAASAGGKISKGWVAVVAAVAIALIKKAWFIIFLPFAFIGKLFRRKKRTPETASPDAERIDPHF